MVAQAQVLAQHTVVETNIKVGIDPKCTIFRSRNIRVGAQGPYVILFVDRKPVPMRTSQAVTLYLDLGYKAEEITQMHYAGVLEVNKGAVLLTLGREVIPMWPEFARKLAGALMRRTDSVDDWQIANPRRIIQ